MVADDVFRSRLQATIAGLRYWVPTISDTAHVEQTEEHDFWKLAVVPAVASACPFELVLRSDQRYDIAIAGETFEDLPIDRLDMFLSLVTAITAGNVVQRRTESRVSGAPLAIETRVALDGGETWSRRRDLADAPAVAAEDALVGDRHFLPYRR